MKPYLLSLLMLAISGAVFADTEKSGGDTSVRKEGANAFSFTSGKFADERTSGF